VLLPVFEDMANDKEEDRQRHVVQARYGRVSTCLPYIPSRAAYRGLFAIRLT